MEGYLYSSRSISEALRHPLATRFYDFIDAVFTSSDTRPYYAKTKSKIVRGLERFAVDNNSGQVFAKGHPVFVNDVISYHPDIVLVGNNQQDIVKENGIYGAPQLIIDLLFNERERDYLNLEKKAFEKAGVQEYWLIDPRNGNAEGYILEADVFKRQGVQNGYFYAKTLGLKISF